MRSFLYFVLVGISVGSNSAQPQDDQANRSRARIEDGGGGEGANDTRGVRGRGGSVSREALRERLDSIVLLLSRVSDRMVAIETGQSRYSERIDNINYRLTKLDLQMVEKKSQFSEVWTALRHRLQRADREMERITTVLDTLNDAVTDLGSKTVQINTKIDGLKKLTDETGRGTNGVNLQVMLAAVSGVKTNVADLRSDVKEMKQNMTTLTNDTRKLQDWMDDAVTTEDLHLGLADVKQRIEEHPPTFVSIPGSTKDKRRKKGESSDCWELLHKRGTTKSGVYRIQPGFASRPFFVYCDMETEGGGWTVIQRREDGTEDFKRGWNDYKNGFGNLAGEFWLGNENIFLLTNDYVNELRIELSDFSQMMATATYKAFAIGPEKEGYALRLLSAYRGDAGDSLIYHVGQKWSTYDMDNDAWPDKSCAREHTGAWWYKACDTSNLNGMYIHGPTPPGDEYKGIYWYDFHGPQYSLWRSTMMIRRGGFIRRRNVTLPPNTEHSPYLPHPLEDDPGYDRFNPDRDPLFIFDN